MWQVAGGRWQVKVAGGRWQVAGECGMQQVAGGRSVAVMAIGMWHVASACCTQVDSTALAHAPGPLFSRRSSSSAPRCVLMKLYGDHMAYYK